VRVVPVAVVQSVTWSAYADAVMATRAARRERICKGRRDQAERWCGGGAWRAAGQRRRGARKTVCGVRSGGWPAARREDGTCAPRFPHQPLLTAISRCRKGYGGGRGRQIAHGDRSAAAPSPAGEPGGASRCARATALGSCRAMRRSSVPPVRQSHLGHRSGGARCATEGGAKSPASRSARCSGGASVLDVVWPPASGCVRRSVTRFLRYRTFFYARGAGRAARDDRARLGGRRARAETVPGLCSADTHPAVQAVTTGIRDGIRAF